MFKNGKHALAFYNPSDTDTLTIRLIHRSYMQSKLVLKLFALKIFLEHGLVYQLIKLRYDKLFKNVSFEITFNRTHSTVSFNTHRDGNLLHCQFRGTDQS